MIAGIGFAMMAWKTAQQRVFPNWPQDIPLPCSRDKLSGTGGWLASREYYRICDEAEAAWRNREDNGYTVHL